MTDLYFWLGNDGELDFVTHETFEALQNSARGVNKRWREVDTKPQTSYFFYGILEPVEDEHDEYDDVREANGEWDELFDYKGD